MSGKLEVDSIEKEFQYTKELIKINGNTDTEEFTNSKEVQEVNVREKLNQMGNDDIVVFLDGSALNNPSPTGVSAVISLICLDGYEAILLKKGVNPISNNYTGELVGIQIALEFLTDLTENNNLRNRTIHIFTDCQAAIITAFNNAIPKNKIDIILQIKEFLGRLSDKDNVIEVHWVPGHKNIEGNELADIQAKEAAKEMIGADN